MKIEIEDEEILSFLIRKLMTSDIWKKKFNDILREQIKLYGNEFFELGYKKGYKEGNKK